MWIDDDMLLRCQEAAAVSIWVPTQPIVVLGRSNEIERECYLERCLSDGITVLRRYGGGGTVLLYPGCVVLSVGTWVKDFYKNDRYFSLLNQSLASSVQKFLPERMSLRQRGISDLCVGERKIVGTSLFRSRNYLLYQASILVEDNIALLERYLRHPSKEPDYRRGKTHRSFLSTLAAESSTHALNAQQVSEELKNVFREYLQALLAPEQILPQAEQMEALLRRAVQNQFDLNSGVEGVACTNTLVERN